MPLIGGGGIFGSGAKENSGNTTNRTSTSVANQDFAGVDGFVNSVNLGTTTDSTIDLSVVDGGAIQAMLELSRQVSQNSANTLIELNNQNQGFARRLVDGISQDSTRQLGAIQDLAATVSTGGQSIVAETSGKIVLYISGAVGLAAAFYFYSKREKA